MCAFFGSYRGKGGGDAITDRGYTGHKQNDDLGLIYMNARYYAPTLNRFLTPDSIVPDPTNPQTLNRYSYTLNNPIRYSDPSGHCVVEHENDRGSCTPMPPPPPISIQEQVERGINVYGILFQADSGETWTDGQMEAVLQGAKDVELRAKLEGNYAGYSRGGIWKELMGTVTMLLSSKTHYTGSDGLQYEITYGAETFGSVIEVYDSASSDLFNFRLNMVHEFGHRFNAVTVNSTDMNPYNELDVAIGEGGALEGLSLRGGMPPTTVSTKYPNN